MADDWGCFNADTDVIKGCLYPKFKVITPKRVYKLKEEYYEAGKLFLWIENEREWGYYTSWDGHQFCNATQQGDDGKQVRHKRKTPEPPKKHLELFLSVKLHKNQKDSAELERIRAEQNKYRIPIPNPIPNLNPKNTYALFEKFWKAYPNKKSKGQAEKAWNKIKPSEQLLATMVAMIEQAKTSREWTKNGGEFIPYPATWLNAKGWEDEYIQKQETDEQRMARIERDTR